MSLRPYQQNAHDAGMTRKEALRLGLKHYFTGKMCIHGHIAKRWSVNARCMQCHEETLLRPRVTTVGERKSMTKERGRRWYKKNREKTIARAAKWKSENKGRVRERSRIDGVKFRSTPEGKVTCFMRDSLRRCLKNKTDRTESILGYTKYDLLIHLERQFVSGMSWGNHGEWHIDHITPIKWFIDNEITDPKAINALANLKPEWASVNNSKGSRRTHLL